MYFLCRFCYELCNSYCCIKHFMIKYTKNISSQVILVGEKK